MPRALWTGSLSFGLVNVPVQLLTAIHDVDLHFHQLHADDHVRIEQRRFCSKEDREVPWEEVGHSYELEGKQVVLTDEELESVDPRKTRTIEIEAFVDLAEIDPIYFDHPYFLVPVGESEGTLRAYRLLVQVMGREDRVALGRFVMRTKEYLAAVRVRDGALALSTLLFHDEVRDPAAVPGGTRRPPKELVDDAISIIEELSTDWDPDSYKDCYRARLESVIAEKRRGGTVKAPAPEKELDPAPDLMAALEQTLETLKSGGGPEEARAAFQRPDGGGEDGDTDLRRLTRDELYERAQRRGVRGRSKMDKHELVQALSGD